MKSKQNGDPIQVFFAYYHFVTKFYCFSLFIIILGRGKNYKGRTRHFTSAEEIDRQMNDDSWRVFQVLQLDGFFILFSSFLIHCTEHFKQKETKKRILKTDKKYCNDFCWNQIFHDCIPFQHLEKSTAKLS